MKSPIPDKVAKVRTDISSYLFHFVNRSAVPADTLRAILRCGYIRGGIYPPSTRKTVCFTEAPLIDIVREDGILDSHSYKRLSLWGIGFKKKFIFGSGGLPVIYQPRARLHDLHLEARWRHVDFDPDAGIDYTWQREWRACFDKFHFETEDTVLVVPSVDEFVDQLWKVSIDVHNVNGEISYDCGVYKQWDFIPLDHADISNDTEIEVCRGDDFRDIIQDDYYKRIHHDG